MCSTRCYTAHMHVVITGASSGIGEALAREYLSRGDSVTLLARRTELLRAIADGAPERIHVVSCDLTDVDHACDFIPGAEAALGPIDVLINNAGASMVHPTVDTDWSAAESLLRLNVLTPFKLTCTLAPKMIARGSGCIVDISSVAGLAPQPGFFFYNASKAALAAASESLRAELRSAGVHVVTVYPGPVHTPMADANFAVFDPKVKRTTPTGDARVLARLVARAVERKHARVIYPRVYSVARWFPWLARWFLDRASPPMRNPRTNVKF
jgi:short-subunit dehydrogenase